MKDSWVKVYTSDQEYQAHVIKNLLQDNGLHPVIMDKRDDEFLIGTVHVYVAPEELEKAKEIMAANNKDS